MYWDNHPEQILINPKLPNDSLWHIYLLYFYICHLLCCKTMWDNSVMAFGWSISHFMHLFTHLPNRTHVQRGSPLPHCLMVSLTYCSHKIKSSRSGKKDYLLPPDTCISPQPFLFLHLFSTQSNSPSPLEPKSRLVKICSQIPFSWSQQVFGNILSPRFNYLYSDNVSNFIFAWFKLYKACISATAYTPLHWHANKRHSYSTWTNTGFSQWAHMHILYIFARMCILVAWK